VSDTPKKSPTQRQHPTSLPAGKTPEIPWSPDQPIKLVAEILSATIAMLAEEGYALFSMRKVAKHLNVRLGALQHYFPTKKHLLRAAIEQAIGRYESAMERKMRARTAAPTARFGYVARVHLDSCVARASGGFFIALWALAAQDEDALELLNQTYEVACQRFAQLVAELDPAAKPEEARVRAIQILTLLEGATVTAGWRKQYHADLPQLAPAVLETALRIANGGKKRAATTRD
jgi:AcrR family transcriptional regulator